MPGKRCREGAPCRHTLAALLSAADVPLRFLSGMPAPALREWVAAGTQVLPADLP